MYEVDRKAQNHLIMQTMWMLNKIYLDWNNDLKRKAVEAEPRQKCWSNVDSNQHMQGD